MHHITQNPSLLSVNEHMHERTYLLQVHVLGQLLLQHVLQLLVHLSQVLVSWFHQISEDRTQTSSVSLRTSVTSRGTTRHV